MAVRVECDVCGQPMSVSSGAVSVTREADDAVSVTILTNDVDVVPAGITHPDYARGLRTTTERFEFVAHRGCAQRALARTVSVIADATTAA